MRSVLSSFSASARLLALLTVTGALALLPACGRKDSTEAAKADAAKTEAKGEAPKTDATKTEGAKSDPKSGKSEGKQAAKKAGEAEKEKARQAAAEAAPVETAVVTRGPISAFLSFNTTLETEAVVDIFPQTGGQVETLFVEEGQIVKAGAPLLKIEDRELRVDADESSTNYEHLLAGFGRIEDLFKRNLVNKQDYDDKRFQLEQARLRLERAKLRLAYATVRAPFDGVISSRETQVGARVGTGTKLFSMVKLDEIVARVHVPGRYLPIIAENQPAVITSEFLPNRNFTGWVKRISPVIDPKSGTFKVTVGVKSEKPSDLPPGLFVGVRVITDTRNDALLIPKRALVYEGGERYVFAVVNDRAVKRKLVPGFEDPTHIEALSGFEPGTPVVVLGHAGLKDGGMVRQVNAPPAPKPAATEPTATTKTESVAPNPEAVANATPAR